MAKRLRKTLPKDFEATIASGDLDAMKAVFDICEVNARGGTFAQTAAGFYGVPDELVRWLAAAGADLNLGDSYGEGALHHHAGAWNGNPALLIELGADIESLDERGQTPLYGASTHPAHTRTLIEAGADVSALNAEGETPLSYRLQRCDPRNISEVSEAAALLVAAGAEITDGMRDEVRRIGDEFEWIRDRFNPDSVDETDAALSRLYELFTVEAVTPPVKHDGASPIDVVATEWQAQLVELWELLVPAMGAASTVQGEVIRIAGRVRDEIIGNGAVNWDKQYRAMLEALPGYVAQGSVGDLAALEQLVRGMRKGHATDDELDALLEWCTRWVVANPSPILLGEPAYRR